MNTLLPLPHPHHIQRKESVRKKKERVKCFQSRDLQLPSCMRRHHSHSEPWKIGRKLPFQTAPEAGVRVSGRVVPACHQEQVPSILRVLTNLPGEMYTWFRNNPEDRDWAGHTGSGPVCRKSWIIKSKVWMSQEHWWKVREWCRVRRNRVLRHQVWGALKVQEWESPWKAWLTSWTDTTLLDWQVLGYKTAPISPSLSPNLLYWGTCTILWS